MLGFSGQRSRCFGKVSIDEHYIASTNTRRGLGKLAMLVRNPGRAEERCTQVVAVLALIEDSVAVKPGNQPLALPGRQQEFGAS